MATASRTTTTRRTGSAATRSPKSDINAERPWEATTPRERQLAAMANMQRLGALIAKLNIKAVRPGDVQSEGAFLCGMLRPAEKAEREYDMWGIQLQAEVRCLARALVNANLATVEAEERTPARDQLQRKTNALHRDFKRLSAEIWAMPTLRWVDVGMRALICDYWAHPNLEGKLDALAQSNPPDRSMAELMVSALRMGVGVADTCATSVHGHRL